MSNKQRYDRRDIRRMNAISVLAELRGNGTMSRAKIAASLGLTRATVSNIVSDLLGAGLVTETEYDGGGAGRPGLLLDLNPNSGSMVAVDLDIDRVTVILFSMGQEVLWRSVLALAPDASPESVISKTESLVQSALELSELKKLQCFGICITRAGLVNFQSGELEYSPISGWGKVSLKAPWEARFKVPVYVENEAHAGAIGVHHFGHRPGLRNFIYLSLAVGLGAGVYVDGVLLRGKHGFAGQVGHMEYKANGRRCVCGRMGCWVTEINADALKRKIIDRGGNIPDELAAGLDWIGLVQERASAGDPLVLEVLTEIATDLGRGAARLIQAFNPSTIVIGGRVGNLLEIVQPAINEAIHANTLPYMSEELEVIVSDPGSDRLRGSLATVFDAIMKNPLLQNS